jgi:hypothetical protein
MAHRLTIKREQQHVQFGTKLTSVPLPPGLPPIDDLYDELMHYANVLLGRVDPPVESPYLSLMEVAVAYYSRACEIEMMIFDGEHNEAILKGSEYYKFRTGQLRSFKEMSKMMADLGSRRLTQEDLVSRQRYDIGETRR